MSDVRRRIQSGGCVVLCYKHSYSRVTDSYLIMRLTPRFLSTVSGYQFRRVASDRRPSFLSQPSIILIEDFRFTLHTESKEKKPSMVVEAKDLFTVPRKKKKRERQRGERKERRIEKGHARFTVDEGACRSNVIRSVKIYCPTGAS